jgi:hypothetical protein
MSATYEFDANLGPANTGLTGTLGYQVLTSAGSVLLAFTTAGVSETFPPGYYAVAGGVTLPDTFSGRVYWGTSSALSSALATAAINTPTAGDDGGPRAYELDAALGPAYAGLTGTLGYQVRTASGSVLLAFTTAGVSESYPAGYYVVAGGVTLPDGFSGRVYWGTSAALSSALATAAVNTAPEGSAATSPAGPAPATATPTVLTSAGALSTVYATDEDVAVRAGSDFLDLVPHDQVNAQGTDGVFATGDPWVLSSASVDFEAQGVAPGHVVVLNGPRPQFTTSGTRLAVGSVSGHSVTLRRLGKPPGAGHPPGPAAGLTGVAFVAASLDPQTESASYEINQRKFIDPNFPNRTPSDFYDARQLQQLAVLTVLERQYSTMPRSGSGDWSMKLQNVQNDRKVLDSWMQVKWGQLGQSQMPTNQFSARTTR